MARRVGSGLKLLLAALLIIAPQSCQSSDTGDDDAGADDGADDDTCVKDGDCGMGCSDGHQVCDGAECKAGCRKDADCGEGNHCSQKECSGGCSNECVGKCKAGKRTGKEPPCDC